MVAAVPPGDAYAQQSVPGVDTVTSGDPNGLYGVGRIIAIQVNFDLPVVVTGFPTLELETGGTDRNAVYKSGSGGTALEFWYTVQPGDMAPDLNYTGTTALGLNGGSITWGGDRTTPANLALPLPNSTDSLGATFFFNTDAAG